MEQEKKKTVVTKLDSITHKKLKLLAVLADKSVSDYIADLIKKDLAENKDKILF